ncbi:hypothetical protein [Streptomyces sp. NPDC088766]|uniref:hypothetical protein n=1 Tax=Streptomyces sp. NPDC088766 TaxID=3365893 RepID=UPI003827DE81
MTTKTDEKAIAAPAIIGLSIPKAASGRVATLQPKAQNEAATAHGTSRGDETR